MKRLPIFSMLLICWGLTGCMAEQLRNRTVALTTTTNELLYGQILNNIALLTDNPSALPYFDGPTQATVQVQRALSASYTPGWDLITSAGVYLGRYLLDKQSANLLASQTNQDNWQVSALVNPDKLFLMQAAYQRLIGIENPLGATALEDYYKARLQNLELYRKEKGWPSGRPGGVTLPQTECSRIQLVRLMNRPKHRSQPAMYYRSMFRTRIL